MTEDNIGRLQRAKTERNLVWKDMKTYWDNGFTSPLTSIEIVCTSPACITAKEGGKILAFQHMPFGTECPEYSEDFLILLSNGGYSWQHFIQDVWPFLIFCSDLLRARPDITVVLFSPIFDSFEVFWKMTGFQNRIGFIAPGATFKTRGKMYTLVLDQEGDLGEYPPSFIQKGLNVIAPKCSQVVQDRFIYIVRETGKRAVQNDALLRNLLSKYAKMSHLEFTPVNPSALPISERFALFRRARYVVAPHGGGNYHIIFCQPGTIFLEICFQECLHTFFWLARAREMKYWMYISEHYGHFSAGVTIDLEDLEKTLLVIHSREFQSHHSSDNQKEDHCVEHQTDPVGTTVSGAHQP